MRSYISPGYWCLYQFKKFPDYLAFTCRSSSDIRDSSWPTHFKCNEVVLPGNRFSSSPQSKDQKAICSNKEINEMFLSPCYCDSIHLSPPTVSLEIGMVLLLPMEEDLYLLQTLGWVSIRVHFPLHQSQRPQLEHASLQSFARYQTKSPGWTAGSDPLGCLLLLPHLCLMPWLLSLLLCSFRPTTPALASDPTWDLWSKYWKKTEKIQFVSISWEM